MSELGTKLRVASDGLVMFKCPGCKEAHAIYVTPATNGQERAVWSFNGDGDKPTFMPSIKVTHGHYMSNHRGPGCWCTYNLANPDQDDPFTCKLCHSFIKDGFIQFLDDCTHDLKGQTVELSDWRQSDD